MKSSFKKIVQGVVIASALAAGATSSMAQDHETQPQVDPNAPHISGTDLAKNVGFGAVLGAAASKLLGNSGTSGAIFGAVAGVGKSIYDDMQIKKAAEEAKKTAETKQLPPVVDMAPTAVPTPVGATTVPKQIISERVVLQTVPTSEMVRANGETPRTAIRREGKMMVIDGNSMQDLVYGISAVLQKNHNVNVDIVSDQAALLKRQSLISEKVTARFDPQSFPDSMKALQKVSNEMNMGMLYEDYRATGKQSNMSNPTNGYVVLAAKPMVRQLVGDQNLQAATANGGMTSRDVDTTLAEMQARNNTIQAPQVGQVRVVGHPNQPMNPNYRPATGGFRYGEISPANREAERQYQESLRRNGYR
jgi:hypothetical protein